jgi:hypothetical protein
MPAGEKDECKQSFMKCYEQDETNSWRIYTPTVAQRNKIDYTYLITMTCAACGGKERCPL